MKITKLVIPHELQRYPTVGDWFFDENGDLIIHISDCKDWRLEAAIGYHEEREALTCKYRGITQKEVDDFDIEFEKIRELYPKTIGNSEPGDMASAPYYVQHQKATRDERGLVNDLGLSWAEYNNLLDGIY